MSQRLLVVTLLVAAVSVLATALVLAGLTRSFDDASARHALEAQAQRLAQADPRARADLVASLSQVDGELLALVPAQGPVVGSAEHLVTPRVVRMLRTGSPVSTSSRAEGRRYLVEGKPTPDGGGVVVFQDSESVRTLTQTVVVRVALAFGVGLVVAAASAVVAARRLGRPLTGLAGRAQRLAAGERGVPGGTSGVSEIDRMDEALSALDTALSRSEARQREFLLSVSHEIRTPLTALRGYAEALADGLIPPEDLAAVGNTLSAETDRLTRFTDDLLALARLDADEFSLDIIEGVNVAHLVADVADAWKGRAAAIDVSLVTKVPADVAPLRTDPHRLRQVIDGLMENALRMSPAQSQVTIAAANLPGSVEIRVSDEGPGLTVDDAAHAFERAVLRDRYRDTRAVGSGLGLSIAARLVSRLGATIAAEPSAHGATFRIEIST